MFGSALVSISGTDLLGWAVTTSVYTDVAQALSPFAKAYAWLGGGGALLATYAALLVVLSAGVATLGGDVRKFALAFTAVFAIAYASWILGSYAYVAAVTPAEQQKFGVTWSLKLTNEGGYIVALLSGLVIANFFPRFADWLKDAVRPELYIKIAIVIFWRHCRRYGGGPLEPRFFAAFAARRCGDRRGVSDLLGGRVFDRAQCFGLSRDGRRRASGFRSAACRRQSRRAPPSAPGPAVPILVSSLVVVFAVVEVLILPPGAEFLWQEPLVAGAWIGLAIKTDGAAVAGGGITEALIMAKAAADRINYEPGWILRPPRP